MSLPYKLTTTSAMRRSLLPSNQAARILTRGRHAKTGDMASRMTADQMARGNAMARHNENETLAHQQRKSMEYALKAGMNPLIPTTFVALPMSQIPSTPKDAFNYLWYRFRAWISTMGLIIGTKTDSMTTWKTRPRFKARLGRIPPTAKTMYRELLEAFAAGDKETVRKLCTPHLASQYTNAIEKRKSSEGVSWELVSYSGSPKLKSYMIIPMNQHDKDVMTEQAVVSVTSTQRLSRTNKNLGGKVIPGSEREQTGTEYVVLKRDYSKAEWRPLGEWQIWGTTEPTTLKKILDDMEEIKTRQIELAGWKKAGKKA